MKKSFSPQKTNDDDDEKVEGNETILKTAASNHQENVAKEPTDSKATTKEEIERNIKDKVNLSD